MRESHRILQENTGNHWNVEAVFRPKTDQIFTSGFLPTSRTFQQEPAGNHGKRSENFRSEYCFHKITGITRNRPFPGRTVRSGMSMLMERSDFNQLKTFLEEHGFNVAGIRLALNPLTVIDAYRRQSNLYGNEEGYKFYSLFSLCAINHLEYSALTKGLFWIYYLISAVSSVS